MPRRPTDPRSLPRVLPVEVCCTEIVCLLYSKRRRKGHLHRAGHLTSCACAMASGPWDRGAPSRDISCMPCLSADRTCSIWFSPLPLSPRCSLAPPDHTESLADQGSKLKVMLKL